MSFEPRDYLPHVVAEAEDLPDASGDLTFDDLAVDETLRRAFVRSLEVIGDAAKEVPGDLKQEHPGIERGPWRACATA